MFAGLNALNNVQLSGRQATFGFFIAVRAVIPASIQAMFAKKYAKRLSVRGADLRPARAGTAGNVAIE
jgi:hypothetical protein